MTPANPQHLSTVERPLVLRARPDVQSAPVRFAGRTAYVLKDPLTLEMFHLTSEEFFLFQAMQQETSLKQLQQAFQAQFAPRQITTQELQQSLDGLHSQGLLLSEAAGQGAALRERADRRRQRERWQSWLKLLSIRIGSIDATAIIDRLHMRLRWLFSLPILVLAAALFAYAVSIVLGHGPELVARLPSLVELTQPSTWPLWLATLVGVKVCHELAHAITCKHFGGRCHELGILLLAMIPCLYCDVTDIWRLPGKWQRIAVSAAGMVVEVVIASLALTIWWHAEPGLLKSLCLSTAVVCSVGTILVNANPLLRYDGYYILSDLVEVPNLAGRAQGLLPTTLRRWLMGQTRRADPLLSSRQRRGLMIYAISARIYLVLVLLGIFAVLLTWARPLHLENLVLSFAAVTGGGMLFLPLAGVFRILRNPAQRFRLRRQRLFGFALAIAAAAAAFFWWPITSSVCGPAVFVPADSRPIYATAPGTLQFALPVGSEVQEGDVLVRLADSQSELALVRQQGECDVLQVRYEQLGTMRAWNDRFDQQLPTAGVALQDARTQLRQLTMRAQSLTIRAPKAGVIIASPAVPMPDREAGQLPVWDGSPIESRNLGCSIEPGTLLCTVADPKRLEALLAIDQADIADVAPGQEVRILTESSPRQILTGEVMQVAQRSVARSVAEEEIEAGRFHLVEVRLHSSDPLLLTGARGTAKIQSRRRTLSGMVADQLQRMLRLPW